ncbi:signal transduction histidine kinase [Aquimarina sp. EL_43]|uniref:sensor histidine kinase n=1 Tax=unclassified Aquimarina TaxID=2627091 RepID=UPI0018C9407E|nr:MULTISPECIES: ATP-binding protein [unclassified Aquimarina]MBG6129412.1 signal transduction histidine kinase [Aquimarina sp. EL_35]MBG6150477.1 signal transduction histidine kinase [Aquimarina sp. EL_32]MBG6168215.1 signal transduction histidine kinase [Aquimarina sp. EL_43]
MLSLAQQVKDSNQIGRAYFKIAEYYRNKSINDSAYYYLNQSKNTFFAINDSIAVGKKLNTMGRILIDDDNYYLGETILIEALRYLKPLKDNASITNVYFNLSIGSKKQLNYSDALRQINIAINLNKSQEKNVILLNSKALTLREKKEYNKAIRLYDSILRNMSRSKNKKEYARVIDNLAYTQWLSNTSLDVEHKLIEALNIRKSLDNAVPGVIASTSHLMKYYTKKNKEKAIEYANQLYKLTVEQNNIEDRLDALNYLRRLVSSEKSKNQYMDLYITIKDSITRARDLTKNKYAAMQYDFSEKEKRIQKQDILIAQNKLKSSQDANQKLALAILALIMSGIGIFINRYRKHQAKIALIKERHTTEKRISKKLHDEVGNDIFYLATQLQQDPGFTTDPDKLKILKGFDSVYHKVRDISRDHTVETGEEYGDEVLSLLNSYGSQTTKVVTNTLDADFWSSVSAYKKGELYWVLKELLTNMKKHSKASFVSVQFLKEKQHLVVTYVDNGIGITDKHLISKNGLRNVENRMKDIKGTITFESEPKQGFKAKIVFTS